MKWDGNKMSEVNESTVECSLCGKTGEPPASCEMCHGGAPTVDRAYTLSERRAGLGESERRFDGLNPKSSPLVVGGAVSHPNHPTTP